MGKILITRNGKQIELTDDEIYKAYEEQRRRYDLQNIEENMSLYLDEDEYEKLKSNKDFMQEAATMLRENEDSGANYENSLSDAIETAKKKYL